MPRRLVTSDLFRNEKVAELDYAGRYFFIGLITNADDDGRVKGSAKYLKANIFPYDNITIDEIVSYRTRCHELGIVYYYSVNGMEVISLPGWTEHQSIRADRYKQSVLPPHDNHSATICQPDGNQKTTAGMLNINKDNINKDNINKRGGSRGGIEKMVER